MEPSRGLAATVFLRGAAALIIMGAMFMGSAGTLAYWQGWMVLGTLAAGVTYTGLQLWKHDRALLERRMHFRERESTQKKAISAGALVYILGFLLPGWDVRQGWSGLPWWVCVVADAAVLLSMVAVTRVFRENTWASRVVEVGAGQQVIRTGPYAWVRHPMYAAVMVMYVALPLALGSLWAVVPMLGIIPVLVVRMRNEEEVLRRDLPGYADYARDVRWRLVPGLW